MPTCSLSSRSVQLFSLRSPRISAPSVPASLSIVLTRPLSRRHFGIPRRLLQVRLDLSVACRHGAVQGIACQIAELGGERNGWPPRRSFRATYAASPQLGATT